MSVSNSENYFRSERYHNNCNMKSTTAILVALTVFTLFLESSTAPAEQNVISKVVNAITNIGDTVNIKDEDKKAIYARMESSEAALPCAKKIAADGITEATGTQKLTLVAVHTWLVDLIPAVLLIHDKMRAAMASGSVIAMKAVVVQIDAAVATTQVTLNGFNKALSAGEVKDGINKNVNKVMENAIDCKEMFNKYIV